MTVSFRHVNGTATSTANALVLVVTLCAVSPGAQRVTTRPTIKIKLYQLLDARELLSINHGKDLSFDRTASIHDGMYGSFINPTPRGSDFSLSSTEIALARSAGPRIGAISFSARRL